MKRKKSEVHEKYSDKENVGSKKATRRIGRQHLNAAGECRNVSAGENDGILPEQAAKVSSQILPRRVTCSPVTKGDDAAGTGSQQLDSHKKIKLQLFPINKSIRQRLEKDGCNPFQELTLSTHKKISSVIKHLNTKWNSSSVRLGELFLFPYNINTENLASEKRWSSKDTNVYAGQVYAAIESPAIFRLRYGWFSDVKLKASEVPDISPPSGTHSQSRGIKRIFAAAMDIGNDKVEGAKLKNEELSKPICMNEQKMPLNIPVDNMVDGARKQNVPAKMVSPWDDIFTNLSIGGLLSEASLQGKISNSETKMDLQPIQLVSDISVGGLLSEVSLQGKMSTGMKQENRVGLQPSSFASFISSGSFFSEASSQGKVSDCNLASKGSKSGLKETSEYGQHSESKFSWDFNLTNLSIGGLLSEVSLLEKVKNHDQGTEGKPSSQPTSSFPDSLDAFIAARLNSHPEISKSSSHELHSSILDAEETCHAFPVRKISPGNENATTSCGTAGPGNCHEYTSSKSFRIPSSSSAPERTTQSVIAQDQSSQQPRTPLISCPRGISDEDNSVGLKGIKWEDSLGPFDLGMPILRSVSGGDSVSLSEFIK
ncbi:TSL-kinase interacting protein 1 [Nicotiana tomentosiformis]|uniref:TSL-kinase interacting protein 1 n=1 Tax=Nicotiana tomentosiformis TaxID=4098 RepID=UPI00051B682F|nr:TSL-kinase interacting protein 1 isoform X1 [Nicotiana tomentosiformis]XP_009623565.1 TSL-kinase interacting protein 1 isoform X1 [Nicotiana tomentosiformis]XP_009623566.1 TSL-kinase interacting protein 1 isoform X1 [Nicotiana tomentosiformis]XP_009623567.1 TSL-kinase interacting protein 1 isoform X1 [Nicotiana tomentosiformis]